MGGAYVTYIDTGPKDERGWYVVEEIRGEQHFHAGPFNDPEDAEQWLADNTEPEEALLDTTRTIKYGTFAFIAAFTAVILSPFVGLLLAMVIR